MIYDGKAAMEEGGYVGLVSCLALLVYYFTLLRAGMARGKFGVALT